jgi:urea transport system substrate-binding protein
VGEETYLSWRIWAEAVKKAATFETEAVIKALESGIDYDAPEGAVRMIGKAHHMVHTVGIGAVNDQQGWDIKQVVPDVAPSYEEQVCDLINNPTQSEQFQPEV